MATWTADELDAIGGTDELRIAALRTDGTLRNPVTIWVVRVGDDLYVRSYKGDGSAWYRAAAARPRGRVSAGGVDADVTFTAVPDVDVNDRIDAAYRTKYQRYGAAYVDPMVAPTARAATLRLLPR